MGVKKSLYWNTLLRIPSQILCFILSIIIARILVPEDFGVMAITMMTIGYANLITNFGFNEAIVQKTITDKKMINSIFTLDLFISILLAATFFWGSKWISVFFKSPECRDTIKVLCAFFIITSLQGVSHAILRRDMEFKIVAMIDMLQNLFTSILTLVLAINHFQYWSLVYGQLFPLSIITIILCHKAQWLPMIYYDPKLMKQTYHYGIWAFIRAQLGFVIGHIDKIIIGKYLGTGSLGFYDKAMSIAVFPSSSVIVNINSVMFSSFSKNKDSKRILQEYFKKSLLLISIISFPIYTGLIAVAPYFVNSLLGEKWSPMIMPFQIILFGFIFKSFGGLISSLNVGIGKYKEHTFRLFVSTSIFIISCLLLLNFKINGIAISFVIFCVVLFILTIYLSVSSLEILLRDVINSIMPALRASIIMLLSVVITAYYLPSHTILNLIVLTVLGSITYVLCVFFDRNEAVIAMRNDILNSIKFFFKRNMSIKS